MMTQREEGRKPSFWPELKGWQYEVHTCTSTIIAHFTHTHTHTHTHARARCSHKIYADSNNFHSHVHLYLECTLYMYTCMTISRQFMYMYMYRVLISSISTTSPERRSYELRAWTPVSSGTAARPVRTPPPWLGRGTCSPPCPVAHTILIE